MNNTIDFNTAKTIGTMSKKIDHIDDTVSGFFSFMHMVMQNELGKKKFVRYQEGAELYSMGLHTFEELAREAGAIYKIRRVVLVNLEIFEEYLDTFRM